MTEEANVHMESNQNRRTYQAWIGSNPSVRAIEPTTIVNDIMTYQKHTPTHSLYDAREIQY